MVQKNSKRRDFLKVSLLALAARKTFSGGAPPSKSPLPTKAQQAWQDCEIGILFHFDLPVAARVFAPNNMVKRRLDPKLYNPVALDTDQWLEAVKAAGARYAVFTATHFSGFMQWQSDLYPYGVRQSPWRNGKGDVVADFVRSCRAAGVKPGLYFSTHRNVYWTVWGHYVDWGGGKGTPKQEAFNRIAEGMTRELCSRYGPLLELWFDAGVKTPREGGPDVLPIVERYQPSIVFYHSIQRADHRWIGNERGWAPYPCWVTMPDVASQTLAHTRGRRGRALLATGDPDGKAWCPAMVDVPLRAARGVHDWLFRPGGERGVLSVDALMRMYYQSVGRNCNLVIGVVINPEGRVPEGDLRRLEEFGRELRRRFRKPLAETAGRGRELTLKLPSPQPVNHVVLAEDISKGERVRAYRLEGLTPQKGLQVIGDGTCIGHKRIQKCPAVTLSEIKLVVTKAVAEPVFRSFAAFNITA